MRHIASGRANGTATCRTSIVLLTLLLAAFTACRPSPEIVDLPPGDPDNGGLLLPGGFEAVVVVDSIGPARELAVNENGDIYVKLRRSFEDGSIVALRDTTGNGKADIVVKFDTYQEEGNFHTGLKIRDGYLYYSTNLMVHRYRLTPGELLPEGERDTIAIDDHDHGIHEHHSKALALDDEGYIYVPFGAPTDNCAEENRTPQSPGIDPCPYFDKHGGIWRFRTDGSNQTQADGELYATGLRSMTAMNWNPGDGELYIVQHGRDYLHRFWPQYYSQWDEAMLPAEEFIRVTQDGEFSWPYCYYDQLREKLVLSPEYGGDGKIVGRCTEFEEPLLGFPGHFSPNHLEFYHGDQFPDHYRGGAFVAFHGSYHRNPYPQAGYFVAFVPLLEGEFSREWEVFANGFAGVDPIVSTGDARHRPTGLAVGPDGSLYISDGVRGTIWRVMFRGDREQFGTAQLAPMEEEKRTAGNIRTPHEIEDNLLRTADPGGETLYANYCQACHQSDAQGMEGLFPPLADNDRVSGPKEYIISVILRGLDGALTIDGERYDHPMPPMDDLSDREIAEIATWVRQNFENRGDAVAPEDVASVRARIGGQP